MLGMTMALRLAQSGKRVTLFEAASDLGGLTASFTEGHMSWDRFYHVIEARDLLLLELIKEIGLEQEIIWRKTQTNFYDGKSLYPLNGAIDYLQLPALGTFDKLRLAFTILSAAAKRGHPVVHAVTAALAALHPAVLLLEDFALPPTHVTNNVKRRLGAGINRRWLIWRLPSRVLLCRHARCLSLCCCAPCCRL